MKAADQYHVGIVVDDLDGALAEFAELFGYEWTAEFAGRQLVRFPDEEVEVDYRFVYSMATPRIEVIQSQPGTLWVPAATSGVHHCGYWSDDVLADGEELAARGYTVEVMGVQPNGTPHWSYHRREGRPRIEFVSRALQPLLDTFWGAAPS